MLLVASPWLLVPGFWSLAPGIYQGHVRLLALSKESAMMTVPRHQPIVEGRHAERSRGTGRPSATFRLAEQFFEKAVTIITLFLFCLFFLFAEGVNLWTTLTLAEVN